MKAIIVENEDYVAENLKTMLSIVAPEIKIKSIAKTVDAALIAIGKFQPEIIFLDIELDGEKTGIDLLKEIEKCTFKVIFTTSFDEYALAAFKLNAVDFLLKPYIEDELSNAIKK
ncbi:MAG: response regulator, partial [Saprospiraceae bacterium]|nr:response regulator [Saprospiraceae bacterium]